MPDPAAPELIARARRVLGMFVAMVGSGIALETAAVRTGLGIMVVGLGLMCWGLAAADRPSWWRGAPVSDPAATQRAPESAP
jgi:hypothetical protein